MRTLYRLGSTGPEVAALKKHVLPHDETFSSVFRAAVIQWQRENGLAADGIVGPASLAKAASQGFVMPANPSSPPPHFEPPRVGAAPEITRLPRDNRDEMTKFYGAPSASPNYLAWFSFPHPQTRLYSRTGSLLRDHVGDSRLDHRTHKLLAGRLTNALAEIWITLGRAEFERQGWHVYSGSHNYRPTTSGGRLSTHAWAAAVDFNGSENPFNSTRTTFSSASIDIMEKWGFLSGGRAWGKDWMHFQAAIPGLSRGSYYATRGLPIHIMPAFP